MTLMPTTKSYLVEIAEPDKPANRSGNMPKSEALEYIRKQSGNFPSGTRLNLVELSERVRESYTLEVVTINRLNRTPISKLSELNSKVSESKAPVGALLSQTRTVIDNLFKDRESEVIPTASIRDAYDASGLPANSFGAMLGRLTSLNVLKKEGESYRLVL
jgi:hypothetical protein